MKKKTLLLTILVVSSMVNSQTILETSIKPRLSFNYNNINDKKVCKIISKSEDTLYGCYNKTINLDYLNESLYHEGLFKRYRMMIFRFSNSKSKTVHYLKQWSTPIVIYIDKNLPKTIREKFKDFYAQLKNIPNLNITFTNNFDRANYYIKTTSKEVNGYSEDYEFRSEKARENSILTGANYNLYKDKNEKHYAGILKIKISNSKSNEMRLKQLKQLFFMSLGQFSTGLSVPKNSLLHRSYDNSDTIISHDLDYLKLHYGTIYSQKIDGTTFEELIKIYEAR